MLKVISSSNAEKTTPKMDENKAKALQAVADACAVRAITSRVNHVSAGTGGIDCF